MRSSTKFLAASVVVAVVLLAVGVRVGSCGESLWVDELHSAWAVWGGAADVAGRAAAGNQPPLYFWLLWAWRQVIGSSEVALRAPSVILWAAACAVIAVAAARSSGRWWVGALAGVLLAVERNGIFFGTEVRPFAAVALMTSITAASLIGALERGSLAARVTLPLAAAGAFLFHYTAALTVGLLIAGGFLVALRRRRREQPSGLGVVDLVAVGGACAAAILLAAPHLRFLWGRRAMWSRFAEPSGAGELLSLWPWLPLVAIPGVVVLGRWLVVRRSERGAAADAERVWPLLLGVVVVATLLAWGLSAGGIVAIWHRRYLIGALPLLCWAAADLWGQACPQSGRIGGHGRGRRSLATAAMVAALLPLVVVQGTAVRLIRGDGRLVRRGEGWREAVRWMQAQGQANQGERVYCAAMLIESHRLDADGAAEDASWLEPYLCFPLASIYRATPCIPLGGDPRRWPERIAVERRGDVQGTSPRRLWIVARVDRRSADWLERFVFADVPFAGGVGDRRQFGNVAVWPVAIEDGERM